VDYHGNPKILRNLCKHVKNTLYVLKVQSLYLELFASVLKSFPAIVTLQQDWAMELGGWNTF
jgi:hypothetical protein